MASAPLTSPLARAPSRAERSGSGCTVPCLPPCSAGALPLLGCTSPPHALPGPPEKLHIFRKLAVPQPPRSLPQSPYVLTHLLLRLPSTRTAPRLADPSSCPALRWPRERCGPQGAHHASFLGWRHPSHLPAQAPALLWVSAYVLPPTPGSGARPLHPHDTLRGLC